MGWLLDYWPWWVALFWLIAYELWALYRQSKDPVGAPRTLSYLATRAARRAPWTSVAVTVIVVVLVLHFYAGLWWGW